jgi:predicted Kef-type K+ transport protein
MDDKSFKINLNQNLWVLVASLLSLGLAEYFDLHLLLVIGLILSLCSTISVIFTLTSYTKKYCRDKNL